MGLSWLLFVGHKTAKLDSKAALSPTGLAGRPDASDGVSISDRFLRGHRTTEVTSHESQVSVHFWSGIESLLVFPKGKVI